MWNAAAGYGSRSRHIKWRLCHTAKRWRPVGNSSGLISISEWGFPAWFLGALPLKSLFQGRICERKGPCLVHWVTRDCRRREKRQCENCVHPSAPSADLKGHITWRVTWFSFMHWTAEAHTPAARCSDLNLWPAIYTHLTISFISRPATRR